MLRPHEGLRAARGLDQAVSTAGLERQQGGLPCQDWSERSACPARVSGGVTEEAWLPLCGSQGVLSRMGVGRGMATVNSCKPTKNYFFVCYSLVGLVAEALLAFRARYFGGPFLR